MAALGCSSPESVIAGVMAGIVQVSLEKWFEHGSGSADECDVDFESDEYPEDESFPFSPKCQRLSALFWEFWVFLQVVSNVLLTITST